MKIIKTIFAGIVAIPVWFVVSLFKKSEVSTYLERKSNEKKKHLFLIGMFIPIFLYFYLLLWQVALHQVRIVFEFCG